MMSVGIRELRQNPAPAIAEAKSGRTVEVLERGVPVARIVPLPGVKELDPFEKMIAEGKVTMPTGPRVTPRLHTLPPGAPTATEVLLQMREEERW